MNFFWTEIVLRREGRIIKYGQMNAPTRSHAQTMHWMFLQQKSLFALMMGKIQQSTHQLRAAVSK
jgi:hypothetical protein